jgi:hypothetical protein
MQIQFLTIRIRCVGREDVIVDTEVSWRIEQFGCHSGSPRDELMVKQKSQDKRLGRQVKAFCPYGSVHSSVINMGCASLTLQIFCQVWEYRDD